MHGGASLAGPSSPAWIDGRHSKYLPKRLTEQYAESLSDPEILGLKNEIALTDTLLFAELRSERGGASPETCQAMMRAFCRMQDGDEEESAEAAAELKDMLTECLGQSIDLGAVADLVEQRRKLVDSEMKRQEKLGAMLPAQRAMILLGAVVAVIQRHVTDPHVLSAIATDIRALVSGGAGGSPGAIAG